MSSSKLCAPVAFLLALLACAPAVLAAPAPETPGLTFAASTNAAGELAAGAGATAETPVQISEDGRYVAFQSASQNLGPAGPPGAVEGFVKDLATGEVELVSRADGPAGEPADGAGISTLQLAGDGRHVLFTSAATNLGTALPEEEAGEAHVYARDLLSGRTTLVDRVSGADGEVLARGAEGNAISADGSVVAFTDRVANLEDPAGDHAETAEPVGYVRDLRTSTTTAVGRADGAAGEPADRGLEALSLSPDGRYATFLSAATNLGVAGERYEVYLRDLATGTTTVLSRNAGGESADRSAYGGNLAGGGCFGTFESEATNLAGAGTPSGAATYVFDRCAPTSRPVLVSVDEDGSPFPLSVASYGAASVSADGSAALFAASTDSACGCRLYLRDLAAGVTTVVDRASGATGEPADAPVENFALAANGCRAVFAGKAGNLAAAPPDPAAEPTEVFVRQLAPCLDVVTAPPPPAPVGGDSAPPAAPGDSPKQAGPPPATRLTVLGLGRKVLRLAFDGPGRARARLQKAVGGRHHGWRLVRSLTLDAAAAGTYDLRLPPLRPGLYRIKLRLQGDPDNPTVTRRLVVRPAGGSDRPRGGHRERGARL